jgi:hypothetical protein
MTFFTARPYIYLRCSNKIIPFYIFAEVLYPSNDCEYRLVCGESYAVGDNDAEAVKKCCFSRPNRPRTPKKAPRIHNAQRSSQAFNQTGVISHRQKAYRPNRMNNPVSNVSIMATCNVFEGYAKA